MSTEFKLCRDFMTTRCKDRSCRWAHDASYCKLAWVGHCPYGDHCRNKHTYPAANRKDRKKAIAATKAKEEAKCQALVEMEKKGLLPPGTAAAALAGSIPFRPSDLSDCSSDSDENATTIAATSRRGRSTGSRSSRSRSRPRNGLSSAKIAEVAASATATAAVFGPNTAEGRRARSAIAVIRSLPQVGRVLERMREPERSGSRPPSRPASRAPSARSRDSGAVMSMSNARPRMMVVHRDPTISTSAAQEPQLELALDTCPDHMTFAPGARVVSIHPNVFTKPGDEAIFQQLSVEINQVIAAQAQAKEQEAAEGGSGEKASGGAWRKQCPTFRAVVDRVKSYFGLKEIKSTRLNLFNDEGESRPFQSERLKGEKALNTNFMISLSFGGPRQHGLMDPHTGKVTSLPLSNGIVYGFGKDLMENWYHGVLEVPEEKRVPGRGRVSLVLWARLEPPQTKQPAPRKKSAVREYKEEARPAGTAAVAPNA